MWTSSMPSRFCSDDVIPLQACWFRRLFEYQIDLIAVCHLSLLSFVVAPFSFFPLSTFHFGLSSPFDLTFPLLGLCLLKQKLRVLLWIVDLVLAGGNWRFNFFLLPPPASYPYRLLKKTHSDFYSRTCPFSPHEFEKRKRAQFILRVTPRSDRWRFNVHFQPLYFFLLGESIFKKEVNFVARGDRQIERRRERKEKREKRNASKRKRNRLSKKDKKKAWETQLLAQEGWKNDKQQRRDIENNHKRRCVKSFTCKPARLVTKSEQSFGRYANEFKMKKQKRCYHHLLVASSNVLFLCRAGHLSRAWNQRKRCIRRKQR